MVKKIKSKTEPKIKLSLVCGDRKYTAETDTIQEALDIINEKSLGFIKTWGIFTLKTEGKTASIERRPIQIKRIFTMGFAKDLFIKLMTILLK